MLTVDGKQGINMGTFNFLGMVGRKETQVSPKIYNEIPGDNNIRGTCLLFVT